MHSSTPVTHAEEHSWAEEIGILGLILACDRYHIRRQFLGLLGDIPRRQPAYHYAVGAWLHAALAIS